MLYCDHDMGCHSLQLILLDVGIRLCMLKDLSCILYTCGTLHICLINNQLIMLMDMTVTLPYKVIRKSHVIV